MKHCVNKLYETNSKSWKNDQFFWKIKRNIFSQKHVSLRSILKKSMTKTTRIFVIFFE